MTDAYGATHLVFSGHRTKEGKQKIRNLGFSDLRAEDKELSSRLVKFYLV